MLQVIHSFPSKSPQWGEIKSLYSFIQKPDRWYTGIPIKQFLKDKYFSLIPSFDNPSIKAGRWSAYNHMSFAPSMRNIIAKYDLDNTSAILVHPFINQDAFTIIESTGSEVLTMDIELHNIAFDPQKLFSHIRLLRSTQSIQAVVFEDISGDISSIIKAIKLLNTIHVASIVIVNSPSINQDILELADAVQLGSIIWNFGGTFIDDALENILEKSLEERQSWVSWHIETRTKSILEYHLSSSQDEFEEFINLYLLLLIYNNKSADLTLIFYFQMYQLLLMENEYKDNISAAFERITHIYSQLQDSAIPDIFWSLQYSKIEPITLQKIQDHDLYVRSYTQQLHRTLIDNAEPYMNQIKIPHVDVSINRNNLVIYSELPIEDTSAQIRSVRSDATVQKPPYHSLWWGNKVNMKNAMQFSQHGYLISII